MVKLPLLKKQGRDGGKRMKILWLCTVVSFKLSGPFKFFIVIINVRMTFFDAKGPIE